MNELSKNGTTLIIESLKLLRAAGLGEDDESYSVEKILESWEHPDCVGYVDSRGFRLLYRDLADMEIDAAWVFCGEGRVTDSQAIYFASRVMVKVRHRNVFVDRGKLHTFVRQQVNVAGKRRRATVAWVARVLGLEAHMPKFK